MRKFDEDKTWRWVLRVGGVGGVFVGARATPPWPDVAIIACAAAAGIDVFIERRNGRKRNNHDS